MVLRHDQVAAVDGWVVGYLDRARRRLKARQVLLGVGEYGEHKQ